MRHSPAPGLDSLSQAACAVAMNCGETVHTADPLIFGRPTPCDCAIKDPANNVARSRLLRMGFPRSRHFIPWPRLRYCWAGPTNTCLLNEEQFAEDSLRIKMFWSWFSGHSAKASVAGRSWPPG